MGDKLVLGSFELATVTALLRLKDNAYGVKIRQELEALLKKTVAIGAVYTTPGAGWGKDSSPPTPETRRPNAAGGQSVFIASKRAGIWRCLYIGRAGIGSAKRCRSERFPHERHLARRGRWEVEDRLFGRPYWLLKYAGAMLAVFLPRDRRDDLLADLDEEFDFLTATAGTKSARRWYAAQICRSVAPIIGQWLRLKASASIAKARVPSIGTIFFTLVILWFACVTWTMQPDSAPHGRIATSTGEWEPNAVSLEDGSAHLVYSLGGRDSAGNSWKRCQP